jgi:hypothetical protein
MRRRFEALVVIGIDAKRDKHYMYFTLIGDVFPWSGPTVLSETNKALSGREVHPIPAPPPTIRSFS